MLIAAAALAGCATARGGVMVALPHGYRLVPQHSDGAEIVARDGTVSVHGPIAAYTVARGIVIGRVRLRPKGRQRQAARSSSSASAPASYFILDPGTGQVATGLSQAEWDRRIEALHLTGHRPLAPPILPVALPYGNPS